MGFSGGYEVGEDLTWPEILSWDRSVVLLQYAPGNMRTDFFVTVLILWLMGGVCRYLTMAIAVQTCFVH